MKRNLRILCLIMALCLLLAMPVYASGDIDPRGSAFFSSYGAALYKTATATFEIWFDVDSNVVEMQEIGVSMIEVYRSTDQEHWIELKTYEMDDYPEMIDENTGSHTGCVTFDNAVPGFYYIACVTFYAKNSTGIGERYVYTQILRM